MKYLPFLAFLAGCAATSDLLDAVDELALSATTGGEESALGGTMSPAAIPSAERPDPFRECDATGGFEALFTRYDADGDGVLDAPEEDDVHAARGDRTDEEARMVGAQWALLVAVYDTDGDGAIGDSERAVLLEDFTARCEAVQDLLVTAFDTDGDGVLSATEEEAARAALDEAMANHEPPPGIEAEGAACGCPGPDGEHGEGHDGPPPADGDTSGRPAGPPPESAGAPAPGEIPPPLLDEFDTDGDGALSDTERAALQSTMRERIRTGAPLCGM